MDTLDTLLYLINTQWFTVSKARIFLGHFMDTLDTLLLFIA